MGINMGKDKVCESLVAHTTQLCSKRHSKLGTPTANK